MSAPPGSRPPIPRTVWALGLVSLFMDVSSETIHALLPLFLTTTLGASVAVVGLIDGIAESAAAVTKLFSGYLSDLTGRRKPFLVLGYGLGAASKPLFAMAPGVPVVLGARFADRVGKGLRGAPRDALIADVTPPAIWGRAYGLRQTLDTVGAFGGPLMAIALMALFADDMRAVFWVAAIPGALAVLCLVGVEDRAAAGEAKRVPIRLGEVRRLGTPFWSVLTLGVVFTLARFSEAFLVLRASDQGLPLRLAPLVLVAMNVTFSLGAYPAGALSDRVPARTLLLWGLAALVGADLALAFSAGLATTFLGIGLWGAHMALTQGLLAKLIAERVIPELRGSAFGLFNFATGIALLLASVAAGMLWDLGGPGAPFLAGAALASLSAAMLLGVGGGRSRLEGTLLV